MEIAILFALICLNGVFAVTEIALVTARKKKLQKLIDDGDSGSAVAAKLCEDPTKFLLTIQIGITSIGVLNCIFGEAALAAPLVIWLACMGLVWTLSNYAASDIVVGVLEPKRIGQSYPETLARLVARPTNLLALATKSVVFLLSVSTRSLLRLMGVKENKGRPVTEEEIYDMVVEVTTEGVIEWHEHTTVSNVFRPDDRQIGSLMVPRADVVCLEVDRVRQGFAIVSVQAHGRTARPALIGANYNIPNVRSKLMHIVHNFTDYVNRVVWSKLN